MGQTQWKIKEEKNRYMDPWIRVMEKFHNFFNPEFQEYHACPKGSDG